MKFIRIFTLLLMFLLLFSAAGCEKLDLSGSNRPENSDKGNGPSPKHDVLTVKTTVTGEGAFRPQGGSTPEADRILNQIAEAEKQTGCTVNVEIVTQEALNTAFLRACRANSYYADIIQTDAAFLTRYYKEGYFRSLEEVGMSASQTGSLQAPDGTIFGLRSDNWVNPLPTASYLMFYNQKILSEHDTELPLELYEMGLWNWSNFLKIAESVSEKSNGEIYSIAYPTEEESDLIWATLHASGTVFFDENGTCTMDSEEGLEGFGSLKELFSTGTTYRLGSYTNSTADPTAKLAFINRRTAFLVGNSSLMFETGEESLSENLQEDLRMISFPSVKKGVSGTVFSSQDVFCAVPSTANTDLCRTLLPLLFKSSEESVLEETVEKFFYHDRDGTLYFDLLTTTKTDTSLLMTENRPMVENFFLQVVQGSSAKEILSNLQTIFNS